MYTVATRNRSTRTLGNLGVVAAGTRLTYVAQFLLSTSTALFSRPLADYLSDVKGYLAQQNISVESVSANTPTFAGGTYSFMLTLRLNGDYGRAADVQAIADHAFYQAVGQLPAASRITDSASYSSDYSNSGSNNSAANEISWAWIIGVPLAGLLLIKVVRG